MVIAWNNRLKFQKWSKHHPLQGKGSHVEHPLTMHFYDLNDVNDEVHNGPLKTLISCDGM